MVVFTRVCEELSGKRSAHEQKTFILGVYTNKSDISGKKPREMCIGRYVSRAVKTVSERKGSGPQEFPF